jgi:hypothetical protein
MRDHLSTLVLVLASSLLSSALAQKIKPVEVPFVGCKSDGQLGPREAPTGKTKTVTITSETAQELAYYEAEDSLGVLAPRGWHCFETYGSNGSNLYVPPAPLNAADLFSESWKGFSGPAIQLSLAYGGTSGRFEVAEIIARVFPAHRAFVRHMIAEGGQPASSFGYGPYPNDHLTYKSKEIVEYVTPANTEGLGTRSRLRESNAPVQGVAILAGPDTDLIHLAARLPSEMFDLIPAIIQQIEHK